MDGPAPAAPVALLVCTTCRAAGDPAEPGTGTSAGAALLGALEVAGLPATVRVVPVACLSNCTRGCTVALRGPGRWTYVYGHLDAGMAEMLLDGAARYAATPDGLVPWRERALHLRKNCIARIPPLEASDV